MTQREPMAKVDTAWLRMESPSNLMMITGVIVLSEQVDFANFRRAIADRFLAFPRFKQKAVNLPSGYWWMVDDAFELSAHIRHTALPGHAGKRELQALVSELASTPLDHSKPLWQFHLVDNYMGRSVVIGRIHHCYADGMALVQVMLSLTEETAQASREPVRKRQWTKKRAAESTIFQKLLEPARRGIDAMQHASRRLLAHGPSAFIDPDAFRSQAHLAGEICHELATLMLIEDDPPSRLKGPLGVRKNAAWASPVPLEEVKAMGYALGCTVNDVLIAIMTGALHRYLTATGDVLDALTMRATVPVNLRPLEHARELGNHFGLVFLDLPIAQTHPIVRVYEVSQAMEALKQSKQAAVSFGLLAAVGMAPAALQAPTLELFSRKATTVLTNVPGPASSLYLAGAPIDELMFWVPQNGTIGMGISLMSYAGRVFSGLIADQNLIADPSDVMAFFEAEYQQLLHLTLALGPHINALSDSELHLATEWLAGSEASAE